MVIPALIGAGGSLLGGILGRNSAKKAQAEQRLYDKPLNVRKRYEEAGVNPTLAFMNGVVGQTQSVGSENHLGAAIADASMIAADGLLRNSAAQKLERAERLNAKLQQDLTNQTLRPKIPGVYAAGGSIAAASGGNNAATSISGTGGVFDSGPVHPDSELNPKANYTYEEYTNNGETLRVPVGPDLDEVVTGSVISLINKGKANYRSWGAVKDRGVDHLTKSGIGYKKPKPPYKGDYKKELSESWRSAVGNPYPFPLTYPRYATNWGR